MAAPLPPSEGTSRRDRLDDATPRDMPSPTESAVWLAESGNVDALRQLHAQGAGGLAARGEKGRTPLHAACRFGQTDAVTALLSFGVEPDGTNDLGVTPLQLAAAYGHTECMMLLLSAGADACHIDSEYRMTPVQYARENGQKEAVTLLEHATRHFIKVTPF